MSIKLVKKKFYIYGKYFQSLLPFHLTHPEKFQTVANESRQLLIAHVSDIKAGT